jgi:hypothetical protein
MSDSRQILSVREWGYASKVTGTCWTIRYDINGYVQTNRINGGWGTADCDSDYVYHAAGNLGSYAPPDPQNGFEIIKGLGYCGNRPDYMIVRVIRGSNYYRAVLFGDDVNFPVQWVLTEISPNDVEAICGEEVDITIIDPNAPEPPPPPTGSTGTGSFINQSIPAHIQYGVGAAIALAALLYFNFKK